MKLSIKAFALSAAIMWALALFVTTGLNLVFDGYAGGFLSIVASIYPGYSPGHGIASMIIGALYGFIDAGIAATIFAWLYNLISGSARQA